MYIILFFLIFLGVIILFGLSIIGAILRAIFGFGRSSSSRPKQTAYSNNNQQQQRSGYNSTTNNSSDKTEEVAPENSRAHKHKKIFSKDDGEYVDFEEIKEDK
ncbi:DUF4834 family protein [Bacteroides sp.]|uniref:DUF4834 family protein n=1 Tax=Bacteroides sp. TaxID=29523 RepID=UPI002608A000|nr:DUF4834 family protein [Bacteroides sp.]MDD3039963.1 DUF4834 family protein [Bacteroides sp.]